MFFVHSIGFTVLQCEQRHRVAPWHECVYGFLKELVARYQDGGTHEDECEVQIYVRKHLRFIFPLSGLINHKILISNTIIKWNWDE